MQKIRVLQLIDSIGIGGAERLVQQITNCLDPQRFDVTVAYLWEATPHLSPFQVPPDRLVHLNFSGYLNLSFYKRFWCFLRRNRFHIVHTHIFPSNTIGRVGALLANTPVIIATEHNIYTWKKKKHWIVDRIVGRYTTQIIAVSQQALDYAMQNTGLSRERFLLMPNAIYVPDGWPLCHQERLKRRLQLGWNPCEKVIGTVGALSRQKAPGLLLEAFKLVSKDIPTARLVYVGDGPLRSQIQELVSRENLHSKVSFLGYRPDAPNIAGLFDVFVMTSRWEGTPMALLEAMARACPVIVTKVGEVPNVIDHGYNGILVDPGHPEQTATGLRGLLTNPESAQQMGLRARERIKTDYSIHTYVEKLAELYEDLLSTKPRINLCGMCQGH